MATQFVLGFVFTRNPKSVLLIRKGSKSSQKWQQDMLNGIGGLVEAGETPEAAMLREGREEAGVEPHGHWRPFGVLRMPDIRSKPSEVHLFTTKDATVVIGRPSPEPVGLYNIDDVMLGRHEVVPDLKFLLQMALYALDGFNTPRYFVIDALREGSRKEA